jgi:SAM-dependent methyltransferase
MDSYREKIFKKYAEIEGLCTQKYSDIAAEYSFRSKLYDLNFKNIIPENKGVRILELGAGMGYFLKYLENSGYENYKGIDWSDQPSKGKELSLRNEIVVTNIFDYLQDTEETYDLIVSMHVLEHLLKNEIIKLLELVYARLNKNGFFLLVVPNASSPIFGSFTRYIDFTHEIGFTMPSLREILKICGFEFIQIRPVMDISFYARAFFRVLNWLFHWRINREIFFEGELYAIAQKKD